MTGNKSNPQLIDREARQKVRTLLDKNILLEAGAGSGKTSAMAGRFLELLETGSAELSEIIAITFTKKAANELQDRVRRKLLESGSPLADQLHQSFIGTIHSFCGKLLRERPIEAGVDPQFIELDEAEDNKIRDTVFEEFVMNADRGRNEILERLDLFDLNTDALKKFLQTVCDNPDLEFELPKEEPADLEDFLAEVDAVYNELVHLIESIVSYIPSVDEVKAGKQDALQLTVQVSLPKIRRKQPLSPVEKIHLLKWFHTSTRIKVTQKCWGDDSEAKKIGKSIGEEFADFKLNRVGPLFEKRGQYGYNHVAVPFVKEARRIYEERKKALSALNFQDLLLKAADLLATHPDVRQYFQEKYRYILVDEFQDTDPVQARLLMYLTGEELTEASWENITPRPGSLFVVGDPKQSIYSFRRADLSIYQRFKERITETGGEVVEFTTNFRSVNALGTWYNRIFPMIFDAGRALQAIFTGADTVKESLENTISGVYKYKVDEVSGSAGILTDIDHIERIIHYLTEKGTISVPIPGDDPGQMRSRRIEYRDILVLSMKKGDLTTYGKELARRGIPVKTTGADVIQRTLQFQALSDVIRMLAYPEENALLYKVLRGPIFRYTDEELFTFAEIGGRFNIYQNIDLLADKAPHQRELLQRMKLTFGLFRRFASYMRVMVPAAATERIVDELGMMGAMLTSGESLTEISSFVSLIEKIRMNKLTNVWDLNQFVEEINLMVQAGYEEELDLEGENYNAVRMMNLHKAKGLEAPIVILATPFKGKVKQPGFYVDRSKELGDADYGITKIKLSPKTYSKEYIYPAAWKSVEEMALARSEDEMDRLLYVAATRAGNALIISDSSSANSPWEPLLRQDEEDEGLPENEHIPDILRLIVGSGFQPEDSLSPGKETKLPGEAQKEENAACLNLIMERTREALSGGTESYQLFTPSEKSAGQIVKAEEDSAEFDADLILQNSMEVHMAGDQEEFRRIRTQLGTAIHQVLEGLIKGE
ncbi:MAG: UvrD-helicase domain-containing protein, partial [Clostridiales bacterium]|nr:UvrD-helicase domain-containing protein [Clostridiales bacterium]